jgi:Stigma-specific protein, Stig1
MKNLALASLAFAGTCLVAACGSSSESGTANAGASAQDGGAGQGSGGTTPSGGTGGAAGGAGTDAGSGGTAGTAGNAGTAGDGGAAAGSGGCSGGLTSCDGQCVDLDMDPAHCGACGDACADDENCCQGQCAAVVVGDAPPLAALNACDQLTYGRYANQGQNNRDNVLPDFSYAGYERGGVPIPDVPAVRTVDPASGDDGARIQDAIDEVAAMPLDADGFRGAVLLTKGTYQVADTIGIHADGVVLRGEGQGTDGTVITATGTQQYVVIEVAGSGSGLNEVSGTRTNIVSDYVGVGSRRFEVESASDFAVGDDVAVLRTPNQTWIDDLDTEQYGWDTGSYTIGHERRITGIQGEFVTIDIPIVDTIQDLYGGGALFKTDVQGRIEHCGVEDLRLESAYANDTDEDHAWIGVELSRAMNSWVRRVTVQYFGYSAVHINNESKFNTVEETAMLDLKSKITGGRRYPFNVSEGLGNLFQRCYAREGRHNFVTGSRVTGPNVWLDSVAENNHADDGPHHRWATGLLFDNTKSDELRVQNRQDSGSGHGWAGAQVLFWNAEAASVVCDAPTGAMNYAVGAVGDKTEGSWAPEEPFGLWESEGSAVEPRSIYLQQLGDRLGASAVDAVTVPAQRDGRIWDALHNWAGEGRLADYLP